MKRLSFLLLVIPVLACGTYITPTPTAATEVPNVIPSSTQVGNPSPTPSPVPTATPAADTATIRATVYVRAEPDANSAEVGSLETGQSVEIVECLDEWCEIRTDVLSGYVWRGCLSDNPDELKCEVRQ